MALINGDGFDFAQPDKEAVTLSVDEMYYERCLNAEMLQIVKIIIVGYKGFDCAQPDTQLPWPLRTSGRSA